MFKLFALACILAVASAAPTYDIHHAPASYSYQSSFVQHPSPVVKHYVAPVVKYEPIVKYEPVVKYEPKYEPVVKYEPIVKYHEPIVPVVPLVKHVPAVYTHQHVYKAPEHPLVYAPHHVY
ncbi:uncharacterized protein LOC135839276 [Planococcus citri]|uniref:uncharacterized protein LOC135839276 n=1 Tax=Planococcus citri TaxID=170843 RepID=UPI0031F8E801